MLPPAPGRLSTMNVWPNASVNRCATARARMSVVPPAGKGTTMRTGCDGYAGACAKLAGATIHASTPSTAAIRHFIVKPPERAFDAVEGAWAEVAPRPPHPNLLPQAGEGALVQPSPASGRRSSVAQWRVRRRDVTPAAHAAIGARPGRRQSTFAPDSLMILAYFGTSLAM